MATCKVYLTPDEHEKISKLAFRGNKPSSRREADEIIASWLIAKLQEYEMLYIGFPLSSRITRKIRSPHEIRMTFTEEEKNKYEEYAKDLGITWGLWVQRVCYNIISDELTDSKACAIKNLKKGLIEDLERLEDGTPEEQKERCLESWINMGEDLFDCYPECPEIRKNWKALHESIQVELDAIKERREEEERKKREHEEMLEMCRKAGIGIRKMQDEGIPLDAIINTANEYKCAEIMQKAFYEGKQ